MCVFFSLLLAHIKIKISMRNSHQNRCTLCKDLLTTKIWNVEWNGAWFMKYWAAFIRPFSTENWAAWLRQFLPHFLSITKKFIIFLKIFLAKKSMWYVKEQIDSNILYLRIRKHWNCTDHEILKQQDARYQMEGLDTHLNYQYWQRF